MRFERDWAMAELIELTYCLLFSRERDTHIVCE